jgi:hypothetical protein
MVAPSRRRGIEQLPLKRIDLHVPNHAHQIREDMHRRISGFSALATLVMDEHEPRLQIA